MRGGRWGDIKREGEVRREERGDVCVGGRWGEVGRDGDGD